MIMLMIVMIIIMIIMDTRHYKMGLQFYFKHVNTSGSAHTVEDVVP